MSTTYQGQKPQAMPPIPKLHVQVNNHLSQSVVSGLGHGQFSTDPTANLINANSTWSNTLKRDAYANEGTYTSGQIVTAYTAASAAGEINVNWTT